MSSRRIKRINSLLKEVISEVITKDVKNPHVSTLITVTNVDTSGDLRYAKVFISVLGSDADKQDTLKALESASGYIGLNASKKVVMRYFPSLTFILDTSLEKQMRISDLLKDIEEEKKSRPS